ncbi:MAG: hypothetical protein KKF76_04520, partial [Gammaproteobacteria bacterium]|nr:hypothetical protein [Gammaproteobacteria bacterium]
DDERHEGHQAADQDDHHPLLKYFRLHALLLTDIDECARGWPGAAAVQYTPAVSAQLPWQIGRRSA